MNDSAIQPATFIACIAFGFLSGAFFSVSGFLTHALKRGRLFKGVCDFAAFMIICVLFALFSYRLQFPNFRAYMPAGVILGQTLYLKSLGIPLAKIYKKSYNINVPERKRQTD